MAENHQWHLFKWYCVNCGYIVQGIKNKDGNIKAECGYCHSVSVRVPKSRRADDFHVTAPRKEVHI